LEIVLVIYKNLLAKFEIAKFLFVEDFNKHTMIQHIK